MHELDKELKKKALQRARILEGQFRALSTAIEGEKYCIDILNQMKAIQSSLKGLGRIILDNHIKSHVHHMLNTKMEKERAIKELVGLLEMSDKYN